MNQNNDIKKLLTTIETAARRVITKKVPRTRMKISAVLESQLVLILPDYAQYIDQGRKKGSKPPIQPIIDWIKRKNIRVRGITTRQLAFAISQSIASQGIQPRPFIDELTKVVTDLIIKQSLNTKFLN